MRPSLKQGLMAEEDARGPWLPQGAPVFEVLPEVRLREGTASLFEEQFRPVAVIFPEGGEGRDLCRLGAGTVQIPVEARGFFP